MEITVLFLIPISQHMRQAFCMRIEICYRPLSGAIITKDCFKIIPNQYFLKAAELHGLV